MAANDTTEMELSIAGDAGVVGLPIIVCASVDNTG